MEMPRLDTSLSDVMKQSFQEKGFLILDDFVNNSSLTALRERAYLLASEIEHKQHPVIHPQHKRRWSLNDLKATTNSYCCYWEEPIDDSPVRLLKVSHALHSLDPCFQQFS